MGLTQVRGPIEIIWGVTVRRLFFLFLCRFKGLQTVTAQIISIGLRTWMSPVYQAPYAVMKLKFFQNHILSSFVAGNI